MTPLYDMRLGDCLDPVTGVASLGDKSVDHVITDPPYEAEAHTKQRTCRDVLEGRATSAALDFDAITPDGRISSAGHALRISRRWVLFFCQAEGLVMWRDAILVGGGKYKRGAVWVKPDSAPQFTGDRPAQGFEMFALGWAGEGKSVWNAGGKRGVYEFLIGKNRSGHPTEKPELLMEALVRDFTNPGDLILDPFAGSGTTGVAAIRLGRRFIGWEKDPKYHAIACKRLAAAREQLELVA